MLPATAASGLGTLEEQVRRRWPSVASTTIRLRRRLRRLRNADLTEFLGWVYSADLVVASGAGLLADPYAPRARSVLELLETAIQRGSPTAMFGQGVGPFTDERMRAVARRVLPKVELIGLREERSGAAGAACSGSRGLADGHNRGRRDRAGVEASVEFSQ